MLKYTPETEASPLRRVGVKSTIVLSTSRRGRCGAFRLAKVPGDGSGRGIVHCRRYRKTGFALASIVDRTISQPIGLGLVRIPTPLGWWSMSMNRFHLARLVTVPIIPDFFQYPRCKDNASNDIRESHTESHRIRKV